MNDTSFFHLYLKYLPRSGFLLIFKLILLCAPWCFLPPGAKAIPESEAIKKLEVIPVFVITDAKGVPLPIPRGKELVLPLYLESSKANEQLEALRRSNPSINASVVAIPLDQMNQKVVELNQQLKDKDKRLVAPIVGNDGDRIQAVKILREQGLTQGCLKVYRYRPLPGFQPQVWSADLFPLHGQIPLQRR